MNLQWQAVIEHLPTMLKASVTTIELVVLSCVLGLILGVVLGLLRSSKHLWVKALPFVYLFLSWYATIDSDFLDLSRTWAV